MRRWKATIAAGQESTLRSLTSPTPRPLTAASAGAASAHLSEKAPGPAGWESAFALATSVLLAALTRDAHDSSATAFCGPHRADVLARRLHVLRRGGRAHRTGGAWISRKSGLHHAPGHQLPEPGWRYRPGAARLGYGSGARSVRLAALGSLVDLGRHAPAAGSARLATRPSGNVS